MVNRAGILLLVLLFIPIIIGADSVTSSIRCNGASFVSSSVVQPGATWSERLSTSDAAMIIRDLIAGETVRTNTQVRSQGSMGIFEYSTARANTTGEERGCLFGSPENETLTRYETAVLGLMSQGSYSSLLSQGNASRFLVHANGTGGTVPALQLRIVDSGNSPGVIVCNTRKTGQGDDTGLAKEEGSVVAGGGACPFSRIINIYDISGEDGQREISKDS